MAQSEEELARAFAEHTPSQKENLLTNETASESRSRKGLRKRILVVDDDDDVRLLLKTNLEYEGFDVETADSLGQLRELLKSGSYRAVLLDLFLGEDSGIEAIEDVIALSPLTKIIIMTARGSIELAVEAMSRGASSFIVKSDDPKKIAIKLKSILYAQENLEAVDPDLAGNYGFIGKSAKLLEVIDNIDRMKDVDSNVLIIGESGTGKELVARALHRTSKRRDHRFAAVNCGAIPENLLESELFGYVKGAFTDAKADRKGIFEVCSEGTLLLDEIGEMPLSLQVKLLRVLQEREICPVGGTQSVPINTRVIASTNRNLENEVAAGRFRRDLFYRLSVLRIDIPPLRERREDVPLLVEHFIDRFNGRFEKNVSTPSHEVMARLMASDWLGNVRELQNVVERGVVLSRNHQLALEDLFPNIVEQSPPVENIRQPHQPVPFSQLKENMEKSYLMELLNTSRGNLSEAARLSGQYRTKLYRLLRKYKIDVNSFKQ